MRRGNWTIENWFERPVSIVKKVFRNSVYRKGLLAGFTVLLTLVLIFSMSAAWYTNVVKTSDLVFQVEKWGFSGNVEVSDVPILAAPGDSGIVGMTMTNTGSDLVAAQVSIQKSTMSTDMQKRIYFYADTSVVANSETVQRVYLNSQQTYTYDIFSQDILTLSESVYNDVRLKWHWVYDVLGYYVLGALDEETNTVQVSEYLRPVEYAYDESKTTFDADGNLLTVDGVTTAAEFLAAISLEDGYAGTVTADAESRTENGFYPVAVNENSGVWVKLLSYSEIEKEIITDTAMGTGETPVETKARLTITAENVLLDAQKVTGAEQMGTLLAEKGTVILELGENLAMEQVTVPAGTNAVVNMNGYTITGTEAANTFKVEEGGSLMLMNGEMTNTGGTAISAAGAEVTMSKMRVTGYDTVVDTKDYQSKTDSVIRVVDCEIDVPDLAFYIWGNGAASRTESRLIIENSNVVCGFAAIYGNGNDDTWGTDIQVIGSNLTGKWTAIYQPQRNSTITVSSGSVLSGYTGIAMKAGSLYVIDSSVIGTGEYGAPDYKTSGFADTGDAIYVEANYGHDILVEVSGDSTVTGTQDQTKAIRVYMPDAENVAVRVYGGTFSTSVEQFLAEGCVQTEKDGSFTVNEK